MSGFDYCLDLPQRLAKFKAGRFYLYINQLSEIDKDFLKEMITHSVEIIGKNNF